MNQAGGGTGLIFIWQEKSGIPPKPLVYRQADPFRHALVSAGGIFGGLALTPIIIAQKF